MINLLDSEKAIKIAADTRTLEGTRAVYGGPYPAAVLYLTPAYAQNNPKTVQSLVNAFVRGLKWIAASSAEEIAKAMPPEHALGNPDNFVRSIRSSSVRCIRPTAASARDSAQTALQRAARVRPGREARQPST